MRRLISSPSADFVSALREAKVMGYSLVLMRRGSRIARLYSLAVAPGEAGRGIGRALLNQAETAAALNGSAALRLEVRSDNRAAIALYKSCDYRLLGQIDDYYEDGCAALRFQRDLTYRP